jgi:endonuclease/exonuclease/phosphatase (EEP) superfamily protein YafD
MADRRNPVVRVLLIALSLLCLIVSLIKIWPSDRYLQLALVSYIPSPFLFAVSLALIFTAKRFRELGKFCVIFTLISLVIALSLIIYENRPLFHFSGKIVREGPVVRVMHWNVWQNRRGVESLAIEINKQQPQVICLNEARSRVTHTIPQYSSYLRGTWYDCQDGNLVVLSRSPIQKLKALRDFGTQWLHVSIQSEHPFTLLLVDLRSTFTLFRRESLEHLLSHKKDWNPPPDLILGDFNTPVESFSVQSTLGSFYKDCYQIAGSGIGYTWPSFMPMMRIDLILARDPQSILRHHIGFTTLSDHRWQWVDFEKATE